MCPYNAASASSRHPTAIQWPAVDRLKGRHCGQGWFATADAIDEASDTAGKCAIPAFRAIFTYMVTMIVRWLSLKSLD